MTQLWTSICKSMNSLEVSRIGRNLYPLLQNFLGEPGPLEPNPPFLKQANQDKSVLLTQQLSLHLSYKHKNALYLAVLYILPFTMPTRFFFSSFHFSGKKCVPLHFLSPTYATDGISMSSWWWSWKWSIYRADCPIKDLAPRPFTHQTASGERG